MRQCTSCDQFKPLSEYSFTGGSRGQRRRRACCKTCQEQRRILRVYRLDVDALESMKTQQDNLCAICRGKYHEVDERLCIDHDHATGEVRGLLCHVCNRKLGEFERVRKDYEAYLERHATHT